MPEISRFMGVRILMNWDEHNPPHFHALYGKQELVVFLNDLSVKTKRFPPRMIGVVLEWATLHREELRDNWDNARKEIPLKKIKPLV